MATKPILFKPKLHEPEGFNNYTGKIFKCFTIGDSIPFEFIFSNTDGSPLNVTDWTVTIAFAKELDDTSGLEVDIPLIDLASATFAGEMTSTQSKTLTPGIHYGIAKYTTADGKDHIIDMCILEVYQNLNFTLV